MSSSTSATSNNFDGIFEPCTRYGDLVRPHIREVIARTGSGGGRNGNDGNGIRINPSGNNFPVYTFD